VQVRQNRSLGKPMGMPMAGKKKSTSITGIHINFTFLQGCLIFFSDNQQNC
jgi:hypothetical protein